MEVCDRNYFNATCADDEAIIIRSALYGRPQIGLCVKQDLGFLGCVADMRSHLSKKCSGLQMCRFRVPDDTMLESQPCNSEVKSHLTVSYECVKGGHQLFITCQLFIMTLASRIITLGWCSTTTKTKTPFP